MLSRKCLAFLCCSVGESSGLRPRRSRSIPVFTIAPFCDLTQGSSPLCTVGARQAQSCRWSDHPANPLLFHRHQPQKWWWEDTGHCTQDLSFQHAQEWHAGVLPGHPHHLISKASNCRIVAGLINSEAKLSTLLQQCTSTLCMPLLPTRSLEIMSLPFCYTLSVLSL